jgi:hypothetical protein
MILIILPFLPSYGLSLIALIHSILYLLLFHVIKSFIYYEVINVMKIAWIFFLPIFYIHNEP